MTIPKKLRLKNTIKYPTTVIVGGLNKLGFEIADSLVKQGGYVIIVDLVTESNIDKFDIFEENAMISFLDFTAIPHLEEDVRRLDYVFYLGHESIDFRNKVSTQEFLTFSNYLDAALSLSVKFDARFLLTTSIKANQILYSENYAGFNKRIGESFTQTYTDMEVQRYAEGLTMEYNEKASLNTRIIRLGEIIGDGIDLDSDTAFVNLVINAAQEENLILENDGLENEWFIHVLDCAYGLIKAQFAKDTEGQYYSLAYENTYTHLSLAYKIQEVEDDAGEIQFVDSGNSAPPIKIHKPAPNLATIGWMPRISFDKAVRQSIAAAKIQIVEKGLKFYEDVEIEDEEEKSLVDKLTGFLTLADPKQKTKPKKVMAKKQQQSDLKKERIKSASRTLKIKKQKRPLTFQEKFQNFIWTNFARLANSFNFLQKKSPGELGIIISLFIVFVIFYVTILSPVLVLVRHSLSIVPEYKDTIKHLENNNFDELNQKIKELNKDLEESRSILEKLDAPFGLITLDDELNDIDRVISSYELIGNGLEDISFAIEPFNEYQDLLENNTQIRSGTDSLLTTTNSGNDYSEILNKISERQPFIENGIAKAQKGLQDINSFDYSGLPSFARDYLQNINTDLNNAAKNLGSIEIFSYLPELLGVGNEKTYFIALLDNTRLSPAGGELSAYSLVTLHNGSIQEIEANTILPSQFTVSSINQDVLDEINLRRFNTVSRDTVDINDVFTLSNSDILYDTVANITEDTFGRTIDGVILMDYSGLQKVLDQSDISKILVNNQIINNSELLVVLGQQLAQTPSLSDKKEATAQIFSHLLNQSVDMLSNENVLINIIKDSFATQDIVFIAKDLEFNEYIEANNLDRQQIVNTDNYIDVSTLIVDPKLVNNQQYSNFTLDLDIEVNSDFTIDNILTIDFPDFGTTQEISVCIPRNTILSSIIVLDESIPDQRVTVNSNNLQRCIVAQAVNESILKFGWTVDPLVSNNSDQANFNFGIAKVQGATTQLDFALSAATGLSISNADFIINSVDSTGFAVQLFQDQIYSVELVK